jgi:hypothetical protein
LAPCELESEVLRKPAAYCRTVTGHTERKQNENETTGIMTNKANASTKSKDVQSNSQNLNRCTTFAFAPPHQETTHQILQLLN